MPGEWFGPEPWLEEDEDSAWKPCEYCCGEPGTNGSFYCEECCGQGGHFVFYEASDDDYF